MRSTPGRPYPLIIPLSAGLGKHSFAKIVFSHRVLLTAAARGLAAHTAVWGLGGQGGHPKSNKKRHRKRVLQKTSPKRPLGSMGSLREPLGGQIEPKWMPKGSKKRSKNDVFSSSEAKL